MWGARTTAPPAEAPWRFINVRRLFIYIEESIKVGIRWAVFEPNDFALWQKLKRTISDFLTSIWHSGALFGATADEAFYVKCDEDLNPAPSARSGRCSSKSVSSPSGGICYNPDRIMGKRVKSLGILT